MRIGLLILCTLAHLSLSYLRIPGVNSAYPNLSADPEPDIIVKENSSFNLKSAGVDMTAGYAVVDKDLGSALFYWYFDSTKQNPPAATIIWLTGGPGCSSMTAAFGEKMAPVKLGKDLKLYRRSNSWSDNYGVLYIDNPIGVGYSTVGNGKSRTSANESAIDFVYVLKVIRDLNPQWFGKRDFYIFGESYAGHYIPAYAWKIIEDGSFPEFKGIGVGDMWTDPVHQIQHNADYAFALGLLTQKQREDFIKLEKQTEQDMQAGKWSDACDNFNWEMGNITALAGGVDQYNSRNYGPAVPAEDLMDKYFNLQSTKEMLKVPVSKKWVDCSDSVWVAYYNDFMRDYSNFVSSLVEGKKIRVLLYNGADDIIVNTPSWDQYIINLKWSEVEEFKNQERSIWRIGDQISGYWRKQGTLTQLIVLKAGHMVPQNQPDATREMIRTFIEDLEWQT